MNINKLEVKTYKTYKELGETLGITISYGEHQEDKLAKLSRYCDFYRDGSKYVIKEIYSEEKVINASYLDPLHITDKNLWDELDKEKLDLAEAMSITRDATKRYWWTCRDCEFQVYATPHQRLISKYNLNHTKTRCCYCESSVRAKKVYKFLLRNKILFTPEYSFDDLRGTGSGKLRFDFALLNVDDSLKAIIEYDGEYHDAKLNKSESNYKIISYHDSLKNEYCKKNNIYLLRLSHKKFTTYKFQLSAFLSRIGFFLTGEMIIVDNMLEMVEENHERIREMEKEKIKLLNKIPRHIKHAEEYLRKLQENNELRLNEVYKTLAEDLLENKEVSNYDSQI